MLHTIEADRVNPEVDEGCYTLKVDGEGRINAAQYRLMLTHCR